MGKHLVCGVEVGLGGYDDTPYLVIYGVIGVLWLTTWTTMEVTYKFRYATFCGYLLTSCSLVSVVTVCIDWLAQHMTNINHLAFHIIIAWHNLYSFSSSLTRLSNLQILTWLPSISYQFWNWRKDSLSIAVDQILGIRNVSHSFTAGFGFEVRNMWLVHAVYGCRIDRVSPWNRINWNKIRNQIPREHPVVAVHEFW